MTLTLVNATRGNLQPTSYQMERILEVCQGSLESVNYLEERYPEVFAKPSPELWNSLQHLKYFVPEEKSKEAIWNGDERAVVTPEVDSQLRLSIDAYKALETKIQNVQLDIAINDDAHFVRAYSVDGNVLEGKALEFADNSFNAWLATHDYKVIDDGKIVTTEGKPVNPELVKSSLDDFTAFMSNNENPVTLVINQREYPSPGI